jgi:hypothetical protein
VNVAGFEGRTSRGNEVQYKCNPEAAQTPRGACPHADKFAYGTVNTTKLSLTHAFHNTLAYPNTMPKISENPNISFDAWNAHPVIGYVHIAQSLNVIFLLTSFTDSY